MTVVTVGTSTLAFESRVARRLRGVVTQTLNPASAAHRSAPTALTVQCAQAQALESRVSTEHSSQLSVQSAEWHSRAFHDETKVRSDQEDAEMKCELRILN